MTKQDFIDRWRLQLAGLALYGWHSDQHAGVLEKTRRAVAIPGTVEKLLAEMFDSMEYSKPPAASPWPANGRPVGELAGKLKT